MQVFGKKPEYLEKTHTHMENMQTQFKKALKARKRSCDLSMEKLQL